MRTPYVYLKKEEQVARNEHRMDDGRCHCIDPFAFYTHKYLQVETLVAQDLLTGRD